MLRAVCFVACSCDRKSTALSQAHVPVATSLSPRSPHGHSSAPHLLPGHLPTFTDLSQAILIPLHGLPLQVATLRSHESAHYTQLTNAHSRTWIAQLPTSPIMPAFTEPSRIKCTYKDCDLHFDSERAMKSHKRHDDDHDYCHKCDEDFDCFDDLAHHKIFRPDTHNKACRVCGQEFKSDSGLKRHIELVSLRTPTKTRH
jgi:hypothetical protein